MTDLTAFACFLYEISCPVIIVLLLTELHSPAVCLYVIWMIHLNLAVGPFRLPFAQMAI